MPLLALGRLLRPGPCISEYAPQHVHTLTDDDVCSLATTRALQVCEGDSVWSLQLLGASDCIDSVPGHAPAPEAILHFGHDCKPHAAPTVPVRLPAQHPANACVGRVLHCIHGLHGPAGYLLEAYHGILNCSSPLSGINS